MTDTYAYVSPTGIVYYFEEAEDSTIFAGSYRYVSGPTTYPPSVFKGETAYMDAYRDMNDHYVFEKSYAAYSNAYPLGLPPLEDWVKETP